MIRKLLSTAALLLALAPSGVGAAEYNGLCEVSAGVFVDALHFAVASDETNRLQIYHRGRPDPISPGFDMQPFTSFDKSDLEAAAVIVDRIYWISSHSFTRAGEDKPKRKVLFATRIVFAGGKPTLRPVGHPVTTLQKPLAKAFRVKRRQMNVEAMAATPTGELLIGLRAPLRKDKALVVRLKNPAAVVDRGANPKFGRAMRLDLGGLGLRSMEYVNDLKYVIVAGPLSDSRDGFAIFRWAGPGTKPEKIEGLDLSGIKPEAAMKVPGEPLVQLLSDDDDICNDEQPESPSNQRRFRSIDVAR